MSKFYLQGTGSRMVLFCNPRVVHYHSQTNKRTTRNSLLESSELLHAFPSNTAVPFTIERVNLFPTHLGGAGFFRVAYRLCPSPDYAPYTFCHSGVSSDQVITSPRQNIFLKVYLFKSQLCSQRPNRNTQFRLLLV